MRDVDERSTELAADLVVVGAGIVGLAHAYHAHRAGLEVTVVERDEFAVGASIRNFGHVCMTAQAGLPLQYAQAAREDWLRLATDAGLPVRETGTVVLARTAIEQRVLHEFVAERGTPVRLLDAQEAARAIGFEVPGLIAAALLPADLRVDAPAAIPALAAYLASRGVRFLWRTNVLDVEDGAVLTTRGRVRAPRVIIAVGHDLDRLMPDAADSVGMQRCRLRMLEVDPPTGAVVTPAVLTGTSMLRYDGFTAMPSAPALRAEVLATDPRLLAETVNLMMTQRPDGRLIIGDTHRYSVTEPPFEDESAEELLLEAAGRLLGAPLTVRRRWRGVYASSAETPFLVTRPRPGVTAVSVTSGIGMTTSFGLARAVLADDGAARAARPALVPS